MSTDKFKEEVISDINNASLMISMGKSLYLHRALNAARDDLRIASSGMLRSATCTNTTAAKVTELVDKIMWLESCIESLTDGANHEY